MASYFKSDGKYIYLEADYAEFYLPEDYFDETGKFAEDKGDMIRTLGIFTVGIFEKDKLKEIKTFNVPTWIELYSPSTESRIVNISRNPKEVNEVKCKVINYQKGAKIMSSSVIQDSDNAESYMNLIIKGKLPQCIPYSKMMDSWQKNLNLNNVGFGVMNVIEEMILATMCRDRRDPSKKFCQVVTTEPLTDYDYKMNNVRQICQYTSTFNAITFEDMDSMITTSLNRTKNKGVETPSPVEVILKQ